MSLLITDAGLAASIRAQELDVHFKITHVAIGASGYTPTASQTELHYELVRKPVTIGSVLSPGRLHFEVAFDDDSEYEAREIGYYLEDGTLFAVDSRDGDVISIKRKDSIVTEIFELNLAGSEITHITVDVMGFISATDRDIDNETTAKRVIELPQLWRAFTRKVRPATTTIAGFVKLNNSVTSNSISEALTANMGRYLHEKVNTALNAANEKWTYVTATTSRSGAVMLNDTVTSTSKLQALTANMGRYLHEKVKTAQDTANAKWTYVTATTSRYGAVLLSNLYNGTSQTKVTTEKALSDGLRTKSNAVHHHSASDIVSGTFAKERLPNASTAAKGASQLNDTVTSTSKTQSLTANMGRYIWAKAVDAKTSADAAMTEALKAITELEANALYWKRGEKVSNASHSDDSHTLDGKTVEEIMDTINVGSGDVFGVDYIPKQSGCNHILVMGKDGKLYTWGSYSSSNMPLGGQSRNVSKPLQVMLDYSSGVKKFTTTHYENYVLMNDGRLYHWGRNQHGQAGLGHTNEVTIPTKIKTGVSDFSAVEQNQFDANKTPFYYQRGGEWYGQGGNTEGRMGDGSTDSKLSPIRLSISGETITHIWAFGGGYGCTFAKCASGRIYACGHNSRGQLGVGNKSTCRSWKLVVGTGSSLTFTQMTGACGGNGGSGNSGGTVAGLTSGGKVYVWGENAFGGLGLNLADKGFDQITPTPVSINFTVTDFILCGGGDYPTFFGWNSALNKVVKWGCNNYGQLSQGNTEESIKPIYESRTVRDIITNNGGQVNSPNCHVSLLSGNGDIYSAASNSQGAVGSGDTEEKTRWTKMHFYEGNEIKQVFIAHGTSGNSVTLIVMNDGRLFGCGYNGNRILDGLYHEYFRYANTEPVRIN
ncbi:phage tail protein [Vibrio clamense]|uniref:phage tail-collar fiber domain-containing protein n=1 Tax=Vibrio clamense TaxID=2910254 RepID=UPI003D257D48